MKILLINAPIPQSFYNQEYYPPSSLLYLGAVLINHGETVKILDLKIYKNNPKQTSYGEIIKETILEFTPDLVGITGLYSGNFPDELRYSILIKSAFKNIPIVIGGIHPTIYAKEILQNCPSIDWVVLGEGEKTILDLVSAMKNQIGGIEKIPGIAYRKNGEVIINPKMDYIKNIDEIPFPAYDLIRLEDYYVDTSQWHNPKKLPINTSIPIISSRSCPNRCPFCCIYYTMGYIWRARSAQNVVSEIEYLYHTYNHRHFSIMDDNFSLSKSRVLEICRLIIKKKMNIQFDTPNGLSMRTLDGEVIDAMVSAGMVRTAFAIESGSDYIRNEIIKKYLSRKKIYEIIGLTKKYPELHVSAFFIVGMPEETEKTLMDTYNMIKDINVNKIHLMNIIPFPGTKVYEQALRDNLLIDINPDEIYKSDEFYLRKDNRFFIKPYKLDISALRQFRAQIDELVSSQKKSLTHMATNEKIDAVILCGGKGTRFLPVSEDIPKVMADIHGRPFLDILIEYLLRHNFEKIILCLGYMADFIKDHYQKSECLPHLIFSEEKKPLGTGGAIKNAQPHISTETFLVVNGDSYCSCPLHRVIEFHISRADALITIVLTKTNDRNDTGNVMVNQEDYSIESFLEKSSLSEEQKIKAYVNAGIYLFDKKILDFIPTEKSYSLEYALFPQFAKKGMYGYIHDSSLIDIGTPDRYSKALDFFKK